MKPRPKMARRYAPQARWRWHRRCWRWRCWWFWRRGRGLWRSISRGHRDSCSIRRAMFRLCLAAKGRQGNDPVHLSASSAERGAGPDLAGAGQQGDAGQCAAWCDPWRGRPDPDRALLAAPRQGGEPPEDHRIYPDRAVGHRRGQCRGGAYHPVQAQPRSAVAMDHGAAELTSPEAITVLAGTITMTPGTVSAMLSADSGSLLVHCLHTDDPDGVRDQIKSRYERRLMESFQ